MPRSEPSAVPAPRDHPATRAQRRGDEQLPQGRRTLRRRQRTPRLALDQRLYGRARRGTAVAVPLPPLARKHAVLVECKQKSFFVYCAEETQHTRWLGLLHAALAAVRL